MVGGGRPRGKAIGFSGRGSKPFHPWDPPAGGVCELLDAGWGLYWQDDDGDRQTRRDRYTRLADARG